MRLVACSIIAVGFVTCSQSVKLQDRARGIEFVGHDYLGKHGGKCEEVGTVQARAIPAELSTEKGLSVVDIKLKNQAAKLGATHVLRWPTREWPCNKDGADNPESERTCSEGEGSAMTCIVGRGT